MIIDLSVLINLDTPVYPGDKAPKIEPACVMDRDNCVDYYISIGTHLGTHIDAPAHMIAGGKGLAQIPLDTFVGRGRYVKVIDRVFDLEAVRSAGVLSGDIVIFDTGFAEMYHEPQYFTDYPILPIEIARYLVESGAKMVGFDMCSPDKEIFGIHKLLLGNDVLIIENLTNLGRLAGKDFKVYALPIKFELEAAPARVIAEII